MVCYDEHMPHIHELYDFTISAFIVFDDRVLLVNHPRYNFWLAPGGHVELDEDPDETLFREITEETGYKPNEIRVLSTKPDIKGSGIKPLFTPNYMDTHEANAPHRHISLMYFVKALHGSHLKSDEHTDARWFTQSEIESGRYKTPADTKFFAKEAIKLARNT